MEAKKRRQGDTEREGTLAKLDCAMPCSEQCVDINVVKDEKLFIERFN